MSLTWSNQSSLMRYRGIAQDLEGTFQDGTVWGLKESPSKLCADVKVHSAEGVCCVGFARDSKHVRSHPVSVVPGPM